MRREELIISIMGPTGVGKTNLGIELSKQLDASIVSVDSVQVYKRLDIGSGKLSKERLQKFPHKLIDIAEPTDPYSTAKFNGDVSKVVKEIFGNHKVPLLVGGAMLYFNSFIQGLSKLPEADETIRKDLLTKALDIGWPAMHKELKKIDLEASLKIHENDSQRIQRALEVFLITGKPLSILQKLNQKSKLNKHKIIQFAIAPQSREILKKTLEDRFLDMLDKGLVQEVEALTNIKGIKKDLPSMRSVGYKQVWEYLDGNLSKDKMILSSISATRQLAKRQLTWLKNWKDLIWIPQNVSEALQFVIKSLDSKKLL